MHADARRFEYATPNTAGVYALKAALEFILAVGVDTVAQHVIGLTDDLCERLTHKGWRVRSPRGDGEKSGIVSFVKEGTDAGQVCARLFERDVIVTERGGGVRAAAHVYNDATDVDRLIDALPG